MRHSVVDTIDGKRNLEDVIDENSQAIEQLQICAIKMWHII